MKDGGKGSKRRLTDEEAYAENYQKIFRMKQQEEWREEIINELQKESLTKRVKWKAFKEKDNDG